MSKLSCVHQTFVRSWSNFRAFTRLFMRSCPDFSASISLLCVHQILCVHVQTFVRPSDFRLFTRLSCVHDQTFVRSPDISCVHQTFVRQPDFRAFMSKLSCVHQTFVRSWSIFRAFTRLFMRSCPDFIASIRLLCVHQTFVRSCPDFRAFIRLSWLHVQTFVRSWSDFRAFTRLSCVHVQTLVRPSDFCAFMIWLLCVQQTFRAFSRLFVRSCPDFRASIRLLCVKQTFERLCPNFRAFTRPSCVCDQTFVRSPDFSCVHVQTL